MLLAPTRSDALTSPRGYALRIEFDRAGYRETHPHSLIWGRVRLVRRG
ncbi:hypothetical protein HMPREF1556_01971 [Porphyromonas sp. oral taxon 278 str. W7784]|nr:hypothetical protein HMPREF1556_01971 [Porphyromonas sp. oral taxon 278 str. W7784]